ncbi:peroxidase 12-like [Prosopis cineraria]|uniref:peroxidase 12-like n=1 Tax=Prosopis cineraria TaxID=364024 RepID=UPI00240FB2B5|nr:peroxidase 12-like [Prosopis cineraria]
MASTTSLHTLALLSSTVLLLLSHIQASEAQYWPPIVKGLSWTFYQSSCPQLEGMVRNHLTRVFRQDIGQAAGIVRIFFHDCFVQGCDGSVLLDGVPPNHRSEKDTPPNKTLRREALQTIEALRALVHRRCGRVVSCSDLTVLAARDAVFLSGGPDFPVPLGRRDSLNFSVAGANNLPGPSSSTGDLLGSFGAQNFDAIDVVALSGAHTFGCSHCGSFFRRISPTVDRTMDPYFAAFLKAKCPAASSPNTASLDVRTPNIFDNQYYVDLINRQGLFTSDQDLFNDHRTKNIVVSFARNQRYFFNKFVNAMIKMSQLSVLTGNQGEIRRTCSATNGGKTSSVLPSVVEDMEELTQF